MLISCEKENNISTDVSENFIGNWINPVMVDSNWMYERSRFLKDNEYGFSLKTEDIFIERKYAGWCGTPPAAYSDFNGTWNLADSIFNITVGYWGGAVEYKWRLIEVEEDKLLVYKLSEEFHNEL
jgi:hypothetical protein